METTESNARELMPGPLRVPDEGISGPARVSTPDSLEWGGPGQANDRPAADVGMAVGPAVRRGADAPGERARGPLHGGWPGRAGCMPRPRGGGRDATGAGRGPRVGRGPRRCRDRVLGEAS